VPSATPADVSRSLHGVVRAAQAVDALLDRIRFDLTDGFLPQRGELLDVLDFGEGVAARIERYAYDDILPLEQWQVAGTNFAAVAVQLAQVEDALVDLRRAVTWSSRFSGFNWWLRKRQAEMGIDTFIVIAGPGSCRDFLVERVSSVAKSFEQAKLFLGMEDDKITQLKRVRILTVPQHDGASAKWHPLSLGHEVAHLCFDQAWIIRWLADQPTGSGPAESSILIAGQTLDGGLSHPTLQRWFLTLCSWLVETSCDAAMFHYYGEPGIDALATYLSVHSVPEDGDDHPAPEVRIAALQALNAAALDKYRLKADQPLALKERKNSYCELAVSVRDSVLQQLGIDFLDTAGRDEVNEKAAASLIASTTPRAGDWQAGWVIDKPATVEAGLVGSLWASLSGDRVDTPPDHRQLKLLETQVEHAVDFLQFFHRFEVARLKTDVLEREPLARPTNVLYVSRNGVRHDPANEPGEATHDVRLGRHFIVFRRNQIATLNALDAGSQSRQIQDAVEVGWGDTFVLHPSEMVLAVTLESMIMSGDCTAQVLSRSSLGRMGLLSATAVQLHPGFRGCLTLELVNLASVPLRLSPGQRVAQIVPTVAVGNPVDYSGKYQDQDWKPRFSAVVNDWEMKILASLNQDSEGREA
jgi:deoxycytidine triphosphate deaminase